MKTAKFGVVKSGNHSESIEAALDKLSRYRGCDHEREIADDIISETKEVLRDFGLLDLVKPTVAGCGFCASKEYGVVHKDWCIR